jgi:hypothetical protein
MLNRLWLHMCARIAETRAERALARAAKHLGSHGFFCARRDANVHKLRANNPAQGD